MYLKASKWLRIAIVPALLASASVAGAQVVLDQLKYSPPAAADVALLKGAIDIHSHLDPDSFGPHSAQAARSLDAIEMGERAKKVGMRGFVIKQHYDQTAQLAYMVNRVVPGVEAFGQLCLNLTVGGLNPAEVYHFAEVKGGRARIVSMPTWDSENNIKHSAKPNSPFVPVSRDGVLLPETKAVIEAIAKAKIRDSDASLALATGHVAPAEALMIIREAKAQGIKNIIVTHAIGHPVNMSVAQMKEAASLGAYIEFVGGFLMGVHMTFTPAQYAAAMREIGPDHIILSSDSGQVGRPAPDDMIALAAGNLRAQGITTADLHKMMVENPAKVLSLAPATAR